MMLSSLILSPHLITTVFLRLLYYDYSIYFPGLVGNNLMLLQAIVQIDQVEESFFSFSVGSDKLKAIECKDTI